MKKWERKMKAQIQRACEEVKIVAQMETPVPLMHENGNLRLGRKQFLEGLFSMEKRAIVSPCRS